jgi:uncharacterized membrane protein
MAAELITSLWITLIGMVLVFGAIILLTKNQLRNNNASSALQRLQLPSH